MAPWERGLILLKTTCPEYQDGRVVLPLGTSVLISLLPVSTPLPFRVFAAGEQAAPWEFLLHASVT